MTPTFRERDDRKNPNKAEDNDLTRLSDVGPGNGDSTNGTLLSPTAVIGVGSTNRVVPRDEETGGMNSGTSSGITLSPQADEEHPGST